MMCEHDFESQTMICPDCEGEGQRHLHAMGPEQCITCHGRGNISGKPIHKLITNLETALIDNLYNQLAAANARIAELTEKEEQFAEMKVKNATIELASIKQHKYVGRLNDEITGLYARLRIEIERAESAEAQNKRMREALEEISEIQMVQYEPPFIVKNPMQIAKAALEEKP